MENEKIDITVLILAKNEAEVIGSCISAAKKIHPKRILVIDEMSKDETAAISKKSGAEVIAYRKKDFADARNFAAQKANTKWLLYIDADEIVSDELAKEIIGVVNNKNAQVGYALRRVNYYLGKRWPKEEQLLRMMQKTALINWFGDVHESAKINGERGTLNGALNHYTHRDLSEMVENTIVWSEIEARLRYEVQHPKISWWRFPRVMGTTFWEYYIVQGGWKVGTVGLIESLYQAFSIFITYARLWELQMEGQR